MPLFLKLSHRFSPPKGCCIHCRIAKNSNGIPVQKYFGLPGVDVEQLVAPDVDPDVDQTPQDEIHDLDIDPDLDPNPIDEAAPEQSDAIHDTIQEPEDNKSAMLLKRNGKASSSKCTKHINIRYFFITDRIAKRKVSIE